jgi:putative colanic acid biosynthesis acetyltransferase WcaF
MDRNQMNDVKKAIDLSAAPGEQVAWGKPKLMVYTWAAVELVIVTNPWQISSKLRTAALRLFGAKVGEGVIFRPRTRVKFPWNLTIGDHCWIGEGVWFHNQDKVHIGHDTVISQETMITTGSHAHRRDMALVTKPVSIGSGVWVTSRCLVTGGVTIGDLALVKPMTVVSSDVAPNSVVGIPSFTVHGTRF